MSAMRLHSGTIMAAATTWVAVFSVGGASLLDPSFVPDPGLQMRIQAMAVTGDGRIVLGGVVTNLAEGSPKPELAVARLLADGAADPAFGGGDGLLPLNITVSTPADDRVGGLTLLSNGATMISVHHGSPPVSGVPVAQVSSSELLEMAADGSGTVRRAELPAFVKVTRRSDGKFYAWGQTTVSTNGLQSPSGVPRAYLALLETNGTTVREYRLPALKLDSGFLDIRDLTVAANGDMLFGVNGSAVKLARVTQEGGVRWVATQMMPGTGLVYEEASGHIMTLPYGNWNNRAARFTADGVATAEGFSSPYFTMPGLCARLRDGRYVVTGEFTNVAGLSRPGIACLLPDGSPDLRFVPGAGFTPRTTVTGLGDQPDGRIVVAGTFTEFDGRPAAGLVRLLPRDTDAPEHVTAFFTWEALAAVECGKELRLEINRMGDVDRTNTVHVETVSDTAIAGADFAALSTDVVFLPGARTAEVRIDMTADTVSEGEERFFLDVRPVDQGVTITTTNRVPVSVSDRVCDPGFIVTSTNLFTLYEGESRRSTNRLRLDVRDSYNADLRVVELSAREGIDYWMILQTNPTVITLGALDTATQDGDRQVKFELVPRGPGVSLTGPSNVVVTIRDDDDDTAAGAARGFGAGDAGAARLRAVEPYLDRGWIASGAFATADGLPRRGLARLLPDGRVDPGFMRSPEDGDSPLFAVQADGKILTVGPVNPDDPSERGVIRLLPDGRREAGFAVRNPLPFTREGAIPAALALDAEGRLSVIWTGVGIDYVSRHSPGGDLVGLWEPAVFGLRGRATVAEASGSLALLSNRGIHRLSGASTIQPLLSSVMGSDTALALGNELWVARRGAAGVERYGESGQPQGGIGGVIVNGQQHALIYVYAMATLSSNRWMLISGIGPARPDLICVVLEGRANVIATHVYQDAYATPYAGRDSAGNQPWMRMMNASPRGELAVLASLAEGGPSTGWLRLDGMGKMINDVKLENFVRGPDGRMSATFSGQATNGLRIEHSEDLRTWTPDRERGDVNWNQSILLPEDGADRRFYRLRKE